MNQLFRLLLFFFYLIQVFEIKAQDRKESLTEIMSQNSIPGISLTFIENGEISESLALGVKSLETGESVGNTTVFSGASLSKPVFAYLVMQLVDEGVLNLDTPLASYFEYTDLSKQKFYENVTAKMVLSHTSGLPNWRKKKLTFKYKPGEKYSYSGEGYVWLQRVIEHLKGKSLDELAKSYIFQPLEMNRSSYVFQKEFEDDFSESYKSNGEVNPKNKIQKPNAAASLQTTSEDYAKFLTAMLRGEKVTSEYLDQMFTPVEPVQKDQKTEFPIYWGLGVGIQETPNGNQIFQWGDNYTFKGFFTLNINSGNGVVYFTNSENGLAPLEEIISLYMDDLQPAAVWLNY